MNTKQTMRTFSITWFTVPGLTAASHRKTFLYFSKKNTADIGKAWLTNWTMADAEQFLFSFSTECKFQMSNANDVTSEQSEV